MTRRDRFMALAYLRAKTNSSASKYVTLPSETQVNPGDTVILRIRAHNADTWFSTTGKAQRFGRASVSLGIPKAVYEAMDVPVGALMDIDMEVIYADP